MLDMLKQLSLPAIYTALINGNNVEIKRTKGEILVLEVSKNVIQRIAK
jgi:hypothetical protein